MNLRQEIKLQVDHDPFLNIQFRECGIRQGELLLDKIGSVIIMKIDDEVNILGFDQGNEVLEIMLIKPDMIYIRTGFEDRPELFLGKVINFRLGYLFLDAPQQRGCQYDVSDRTETDDQEILWSFHWLLISRARR